MRTLWIDIWKDVRKTKNEEQPFKYPVSVDHAAEIIGRKESPASLLSLLAEECSECAHAALKLARIIRQESPTPESEEVAFDHLVEEITDVQNVMLILQEYTPTLSVKADFSISYFKLNRWVERINEREKENAHNTD